jgi:hypothetical protein
LRRTSRQTHDPTTPHARCDPGQLDAHPLGEFDQVLGEALAIAVLLSEAVDGEVVALSNICLLLVIF